MDSELMRKKAAIKDGVRDFFRQREYLEVETPVLAPTFIAESSIELFTTTYNTSGASPRPYALLPSPELWHKRLLSQGYGNMFEITKCFRNGDAKGRFHNPEFTMLEWYTVDADYMDSIPLTEELCHRLAADFAPERQELQEPFLKYSMQELFRETLGVDLESMDTSGALQQQCEKSGLMYTSEDSWETLFNRIFLTQVEPHIPSHRPCILYDYPARIPCLAKPIPGTPWCERWELYYQEMEIANCFSEETDPERVRAYLEHEIARLPGSLREWVDTAFVSLFTPDFPRCSGVALGMDRLIMALTGASTISEVLLFPF